jgi:hypothetical protein
MFGLDIETLGIESTSVILSIGIVYVNDISPKSFDDVIKNSIFLKLDAKEQIEKYNRTVDSDTLKWWKKQGDVQKARSFNRYPTDLPVMEAINLCKRWVKMQSSADELVWVRGSMDSPCIDSLFRAAGHEPLFKYSLYRDVRTAIDIMYPDTSKNGYVDIDPEKCFGFDNSHVAKHCPVSDSAYDLCMLMFGKQ